MWESPRARLSPGPSTGDLSFDVGAITLAPLGGVPIEDRARLARRQLQPPFDAYKKNKTRFQLFGYPAQPAAFYDGERLILCNSPFVGFQFIFIAPVVRCNMKEGSSGGGWVLKGGLVNSVVSHNACGTDAELHHGRGHLLRRHGLQALEQGGRRHRQGPQEEDQRLQEEAGQEEARTA